MAPAAKRLPARRPRHSAARSAIVVLTMLPERAGAEAIARELLSARLAACIQIGTAVQSLYHWRGQIETANRPLGIEFDEIVKRSPPAEHSKNYFLRQRPVLT